MWLKEKYADSADDKCCFINAQEYVMNRLGFGYLSDYSNQATNNLLDVRSRSYSEDVAEIAGLNEELAMHHVMTAGTCVGRIKRFGSVTLPGNIPVILGGLDSAVGLMGLGVMNNNCDVLGNVAGTFDTLGVFSGNYNETADQNAFYCYPSVTEHGYTHISSIITGPTMNWFIQKMYSSRGSNPFGELFQECSFDGTSSLMFQGLIQNGNAALMGISPDTGLVEVFQAIVESITYPLCEMVNKMSRLCESKPKILRIGGGGAKSTKWLQLKADMLNMCVDKVSNPEVSAVGAAILAAVTTKCFDNITEAVETMVNVEKSYYPNTLIHQRYFEKYERMLDL